MYDYSPTPRGIHAAVEEALKQEKELVQPGAEELSQVQERGKLPEDERQLHSLLMTEGDLAAGELEVSVEWLEKLVAEDRAAYLEQGLWIAAEQREEYQEALESWKSEAAFHIVRRMLRYRGGATAGQVAMRYGWTEENARAVLEELCRRGEVVSQKEIQVVYYHAALYKKARKMTLRNRREEISTCPSENYAALLLSRIQRSAPAEECVKATITSFAGLAVPAGLWEEVILPARVRSYRESFLDSFLAEGEYFWHMEENGRLRFDATERIDWDREPEVPWDTLSDKERLLAEALAKRGASFMQTLNNVLPGESPHDTLLSLLEKGVVCADSFVPVRQWINREKTKKATARQRVNVRVKALQAGRFDLVRPLRPLTVQEQMDACFDRYLILCRETAAAYGLSWQEALNLLRVQEYTGQVRRGYFVKGLSGAQFIRRKDFESVTASLLHPRKETLWLNAADPVQPWGKLIPHETNRSFVNVPGTVIAFRSGLPVTLFERQGKSLRIFDGAGSEEALRLFAEEFRRGGILPGRKRIVVKDYPSEEATVLSASGFLREMQDFCLYR